MILSVSHSYKNYDQALDNSHFSGVLNYFTELIGMVKQKN